MVKLKFFELKGKCKVIVFVDNKLVRLRKDCRFDKGKMVCLREDEFLSYFIIEDYNERKMILLILF